MCEKYIKPLNILETTKLIISSLKQYQLFLKNVFVLKYVVFPLMYYEHTKLYFQCLKAMMQACLLGFGFLLLLLPFCGVLTNVQVIVSILCTCTLLEVVLLGVNAKVDMYCGLFSKSILLY